MLHIRQWKDCAFGSAGLVASSPWVQRKRDLPGLKICNPEKGISNISLAELKEAIIKQCQPWPWVSPSLLHVTATNGTGPSWEAHEDTGLLAARQGTGELSVTCSQENLPSSLPNSLLCHRPGKSHTYLLTWEKAAAGLLVQTVEVTWLLSCGWRVLVFHGSGGQCAHRRHETSSDSSASLLTCAPGLPLPSALGISNPTKLATSVLQNHQM